jgi:2-keto-4-pentenoate hydratase/2-oxohepta-3-ene-1,7-dioic acid hydratase in catechol pathway
MKLVTAKDRQGVFIGIVHESGERVLPLGRAQRQLDGVDSFPETMIGCAALGAQFLETAIEVAGRAGEELYLPLSEVNLLAPIPRPAKNVFCVGKNYIEHALELGSKEDIPEHLMVFTKAPTTVIGYGQSIPIHEQVSDELDYEGELAVVIGKGGRGIKEEHALEHIFGYTIINDVTARDLQARHKHYFIGKSLDGTCPMGPWIVHSSAIGNPNSLKIETRVNGEVRQSSNTEHFIFPIQKIIAVLSRGITLEPGDIIATGTPAGVGKGFKPPKFLKIGDEIEIAVEGIGKLVNIVGD